MQKAKDGLAQLLLDVESLHKENRGQLFCTELFLSFSSAGYTNTGFEIFQDTRIVVIQTPSYKEVETVKEEIEALCQK